MIVGSPLQVSLNTFATQHLKNKALRSESVNNIINKNIILILNNVLLKKCLRFIYEILTF